MLGGGGEIAAFGLFRLLVPAKASFSRTVLRYTELRAGFACAKRGSSDFAIAK